MANHCIVTLSSAEAPRGWERWIGKKEGARGTTGRGKSQRSPRAFFFPLPSPRTAYTAKKHERGHCGGVRHSYNINLGQVSFVFGGI